MVYLVCWHHEDFGGGYWWWFPNQRRKNTWTPFFTIDKIDLPIPCCDVFYPDEVNNAR